MKMAKQKILISIEEGLREEVEKIIYKWGGRFSPLVERLISDFIDKNKTNCNSKKNTNI